MIQFGSLDFNLLKLDMWLGLTLVKNKCLRNHKMIWKLVSALVNKLISYYKAQFLRTILEKFFWVFEMSSTYFMCVHAFFNCYLIEIQK